MTMTAMKEKKLSKSLALYDRSQEFLELFKCNVY